MVQFIGQSKKNNTTYSQELLFGSALISGGMKPQNVLARIRSQAEVSAVRDAMILYQALEVASEKGAPLGRLMRTLARFVYEEEKLLSRFKLIEKQFGFQMAVLLFLPWVVTFSVSDWQLNLITITGVILQLIGIFGVWRVLIYVRKTENLEVLQLRILLCSLWIYTQSGMGLRLAIQNVMNLGFDHGGWQDWFEQVLNGSDVIQTKWRPSDKESPRVALGFELLLKQGAPLDEFLLGSLDYFNELRKLKFEERLAVSPSYLSLILCFFFVPAVFAFLFGSIWKEIQWTM